MEIKTKEIVTHLLVVEDLLSKLPIPSKGLHELLSGNPLWDGIGDGGL